MAEAIIRHFEHDGTLRDTFRPENPHWIMRLDEPSDIDYEVSLAMPSMRHGFVGPYRTDWQLEVDGNIVEAGLHTPYERSGESEAKKIAGKSWLHYLERRHYPFDPQAPNTFRHGLPTTTATYPQTGVAFSAYQQDAANIISDLLDITLARPNSLDIFFAAITTGNVHNFRIDLGDTESIYDKIKGLSDEEPQFNFRITPDTRQFFIYSEHIYLDGAETDPTQNLWVFDDRDPDNGVLDINFINDGPRYTHLIGYGAGTASRLGVALGYPHNQAIYRRLDGTEDYGNVVNRTQLTNRAQRDLSFGLYPQHELTLTINPDAPRFEGEDFWKWTFPGESIWIRWDLESAFINHGYVIVEMDCTIDNEGNPTVQFGLNEINPLGRPGVRQG